MNSRNTFLIAAFILLIYGDISGQFTPSLHHYYESIHSAQEWIVQDSFDQAIRSLMAAEAFHPLFLTDVRLGLDIAGLAKDKVAGIFFSKKLRAFGIPRTFFTNKRRLDYLKADPAWETFLNEEFPVPFEASRALFDSLLQLDQKYRKNESLPRDSGWSVDLQNRRTLLKIIRERGFPEEAMIGFDIYNDTTISSWSSPFNILWIHFTKNWPVESENILRQAMEKGRIRNSYYVAHAMNFFPDPKFEFHCFRTGALTYYIVDQEFFTCCCEKEALIDENRKRVAYTPVKLEKRKIAYEVKRAYDLFRKSRGILYPTDEIHYEKIKQELLEEGYVQARALGE